MGEFLISKYCAESQPPPIWHAQKIKTNTEGKLHILLSPGQMACLFSQRSGVALIEAKHLTWFRLCSSSSVHNDAKAVLVPPTFHCGWFSSVCEL